MPRKYTCQRRMIHRHFRLSLFFYPKATGEETSRNQSRGKRLWSSVSSPYALSWGLLSYMFSLFLAEYVKDRVCRLLRLLQVLLLAHYWPLKSTTLFFMWRGSENSPLPQHFLFLLVTAHPFYAGSLNTLPSTFFSSSTGVVFLETNGILLLPCLYLSRAHCLPCISSLNSPQICLLWPPSIT